MNFARSCCRCASSFPCRTDSLCSALALALLLAGCCGPKERAVSHAPQPAALAEVAPANVSASRIPATSPPASTNQWRSLFDGRTLQGWASTDFAGHGDVRVDQGKIILEMGVMTGVTWTNDIPRMNYELDLEAMRVAGTDFFCGLTFPVGESPCSLIVGGWGGGVVGLSSLDGEDAANNETTKYLSFEKGRWYHIRLRVAPGVIQAWIDEEQIVNVVTTGKALSIRSEVELSRPLGVSSWSTTAALRNIRIRSL